MRHAGSVWFCLFFLGAGVVSILFGVGHDFVPNCNWNATDVDCSWGPFINADSRSETIEQIRKLFVWPGAISLALGCVMMVIRWSEMKAVLKAIMKNEGLEFPES